MIQKHFIFLDQSEWIYNGCDCCPPTLYESWSCLSHPEEIYFSCWDTVDAIRAAIELFEPEFDKERELDDTDVRWEANSLGLTFSFVGADQ